MNPRRLRLGLLTLIAAGAGVAVILTALSALARPELRMRWDISSSGTAGLSDRTAQALANLPEGTRAVAFLRKEDRRYLINADVVYPQAFTRLRAALEDARIRSRGRLEVTVLEEYSSPVEINKWTDELSREPLEVLILDVPNGPRRKFLFSELFLATDPSADGTPARLTQERVDAALGDAAIRLTNQQSIRAGVVTGYGQPRPDTEAGLRPLLRLIQSEGLDPVEIPGPATEEEFDVLIVPGQTRPFLADDQRALQSWVEAGKPLYVALGPAAPEAVIASWNAVLEPSGLQLDEGLVCEARPRYGAHPGTNLVAELDLAAPQLSGQHPTTRSIAEAGRAQGLVSVRPIAVRGGSNDYLRVTLLHSAAEAWVDRDADFAPGPGEAQGTQVLAAAAERWQVDQPLQAGRTIVSGSGISITGRFLPRQQEFLTSSLRWLTGQEIAPTGLVSLADKPFDPPRQTRVRIANLVMVGLPGVTVLLALLVYWRRRR